VNPVELDGRIFDAAEVVATLKKQVEEKRFERIQEVVGRRNPHLITVMENIYDRGNTSAVMRSAEAFGFHLFHQIVEIDTFKESKRVTQGADKWLVQTHWEQTRPCINTLKEKGYPILVTHLEAGVSIEDVSFDRPVALCFGSEREGASATLTEMADEKVYIPMQGFVQSFNISVAAALCFQHIHREMRGHALPPLADKERQKLLALYLYRSCKNPVLPN
jgi:tRNA (guanosine-2'-O-)-methyltransferase